MAQTVWMGKKLVGIFSNPKELGNLYQSAPGKQQCKDGNLGFFA